MIGEPKKLTKARARLLNQQWDQFQEQLSPDLDLAATINEHPRLGVLSALTGRRELWELVVSTAGYISQHTTGQEELTIQGVIKSVADRSHTLSYPDLEEYMKEVVTLDIDQVVAAAPVVAQGIKLDYVTVQMFGCMDACKQLYKNDKKKLRICLRGCF